jgi:VIT1/CCC1 family predicted Fe2+/Mn2+ transporter
MPVPRSRQRRAENLHDRNDTRPVREKATRRARAAATYAEAMAATVEQQRVRRYQTLWEDEIAGASLYRALAESADDRRKPILLALAEAEEKHAAHWAQLLADNGVSTSNKPRLPFRVKALSFLSRRFGADVVLPLVLRLEASDADRYDRVAEAPESMASQERMHGRIVSALQGGTAGSRIARSEGRHRAGAGGALRASVFGINDGLLSNLSLVLGVAGGTQNKHFVILAGVAGLVAGAFSMASGEWVSVRSQRELYEREIEVEREEIAAFPEEEAGELALIYRAKGLEPAEADAVAKRLMKQPDTALDTMVREELGLDPAELASPWIAAGSSFVAFAVGAVLPVIPFLFVSGVAAIGSAAIISALTLFAVGGAISIFTGRRASAIGLRMIAIGIVTSAITFGIGKLIGVSVS